MQVTEQGREWISRREGVGQMEDDERNRILELCPPRKYNNPHLNTILYRRGFYHNPKISVLAYLRLENRFFPLFFCQKVLPQPCENKQINK